MAAIGALLAAILTFINIGLALRTAWKEWRARQEKPHALEPVLQDIAFSLRERDGKLRDLQQQLRDAMKRADESRRVRFE